MDSTKKRDATANKKKQQKLDQALIAAVKIRNAHEVEVCLEAGANPEQSINNQSLIIHATEKSNINIIDLLIKHGADLEVCDSKGNTPLLLAVQKEQMGLIKCLLAKDANINAQNHLGFTSMMYAAQNGSLRLVKTLHGKDADLNLKNKKGKTALEVAVENKNSQVSGFLQSCRDNNNASKQKIKAPIGTPKKVTKKEDSKNTHVETKKKSKKEKLGPLKKLLIGFSQGYAKKYPASSSEWSLKKKNQHAQEAYMNGVLPDLNDTWFFHTLSHQEVQGDTGTNAFLPPESVEKIARNFVFHDFESYVYYQPEQALADRVEAIYKHLDYLPESYKIDVELESETATEKELSSEYVMTYGHGTTEVFDTILQEHIKNKRDTIIVPTPTYGLFIPLMRNHCKIKTLQTSSENSGAIDPVELKKLIEKTEKENIEYYKDYFTAKYEALSHAKSKFKDSNDYKSFSKHLKEINDFLSEENHLYILNNIDILTSQIDKFNKFVKQEKKQKKVNKAFKDSWLLDPVPRVRALYFVNPSMPSGKLAEQDAIDEIAKVLKKHPSVNIIEDVTHRGIVLKDDLTPGSFTKTSVVDRTMVLDGISKIFGLARARASILIGHRSLITPIAHSLHMRNCTLNGASNAFLKGIYRLEPEEFEAHLLDLSKDYQKRLNLLKAVMFGQDDFNKKEFEQIKKDFNAVYEQDRKPAKLTEPQKELIFSGMDGVKLYCEPEAGYFVLIDLSEYVGQYLGSVEMRTGMDFRNAFYNLADVNSLSDVMCYDDPEKGKAYIRYSLSIDSEIEMVEGLLRMKKVLAQCKPTPMEIPKEEIKTKAKPSSPRKKDERKKVVPKEASSSEDSEATPDFLDTPAKTLTFLKDTKDKDKRKITNTQVDKKRTQAEKKKEEPKRTSQRIANSKIQK